MFRKIKSGGGFNSPATESMAGSLKKKMITAGIDIGARSTKTVILDDDGIMAGNILEIGRSSSKKIIERSIEIALADARLKMEDIDYTIASGYGRVNVPFADRQVTEIACHAKGAHFQFPDTRMVIDIGGQDSKAIRLDKNGEVSDFVMNDKCAAGTGKFLEVMADALEVDIEELGELSLRSQRATEVSSMCTVFAESEIISLIAEGCPREDIASGVHNAIAERVLGLAHKIGMADSITLTGGVIKNIGVVHSIKNRLGLSVNVPLEPQIIGALGAALIARNYAQVSKSNLGLDVKIKKFDN